MDPQATTSIAMGSLCPVSDRMCFTQIQRRVRAIERFARWRPCCIGSVLPLDETLPLPSVVGGSGAPRT